jgi:hypothetical protein
MVFTTTTLGLGEETLVSPSNPIAQVLWQVSAVSSLPQSCARNESMYPLVITRPPRPKAGTVIRLGRPKQRVRHAQEVDSGRSSGERSTSFCWISRTHQRRLRLCFAKLHPPSISNAGACDLVLIGVGTGSIMYKIMAGLKGLNPPVRMIAKPEAARATRWRCVR